MLHMDTAEIMGDERPPGPMMEIGCPLNELQFSVLQPDALVFGEVLHSPFGASAQSGWPQGTHFMPLALRQARNDGCPKSTMCVDAPALQQLAESGQSGRDVIPRPDEDAIRPGTGRVASAVPLMCSRRWLDNISRNHTDS